ncbi:MAG: rod shape-determining protein, partial [Fusobacteriaceae bacterium]
DLVSQCTNLKVRLAENPLESVVIGAGIALEQLDILRKIEKVER